MRQPGTRSSSSSSSSGSVSVAFSAPQRHTATVRLRGSITQSHPHDLVRINLEFLKPFKATHTAEFTFQPEGGKTVVTWSMSGENNFMAKAIHLFMNMDRMIGGQFEKGLASMKSIVETAPKQ